VVFIDHISRLKRRFIERRMEKARKEQLEERL
jgi:hypothetical protein